MGRTFRDVPNKLMPEAKETIRSLKIGEQARVASIEASGELGRRIRDMGIVPGVEVSVVGKAPLRDPVALRLSGVTITLRNKEADLINIVR